MWVEEPDLDEWEQRVVEAYDEYVGNFEPYEEDIHRMMTFEMFRDRILERELECDNFDELNGELA